MPSDILSFTDLKKYFVIGKKGFIHRTPITVKAVDGVSFSIQDGETFGLVGESGSGKSTVAYTTIGMYRPTSGEVRFRGQDLFAEKRRPQALRKEIEIVFQDPGSSLNPRRTIRQLIELPLRLHRPGVNLLQETIRLLDMVELTVDYLPRYPQMPSAAARSRWCASPRPWRPNPV